MYNGHGIAIETIRLMYVITFLVRLCLNGLTVFPYLMTSATYNKNYNSVAFLHRMSIRIGNFDFYPFFQRYSYKGGPLITISFNEI